MCEDYPAVNIVGLINSKGIKASIDTSHSGDAAVKYCDVAKLNEKLIKGLKIFRVVENISTVVVHRSVMAFIAPK